MTPSLRGRCKAPPHSVDRHPPTPSIPALRRRRVSAGGFSSASSGRNGRRKWGMAARSCAPAATANVRVLAPVKWGRSRRGGAYVFSPQAEMHRARAPLSASLGTFSAWRKYLALRRNIYTHPPPNFGIGGSAPYGPPPLRGRDVKHPPRRGRAPTLHDAGPPGGVGYQDTHADAALSLLLPPVGGRRNFLPPTARRLAWVVFGAGAHENTVTPRAPNSSFLTPNS